MNNKLPSDFIKLNDMFMNFKSSGGTYIIVISKHGSMPFIVDDKGVGTTYDADGNKTSSALIIFQSLENKKG